MLGLYSEAIQIEIRRRWPKHTGHLLSREPPAGFPLFRPGHALNRPRLLHQRRVELRRHSSHNRPVIPREFSRGDRHGRSPPEVIRRIAQIGGNFSRPRRCIVADRCSVGSSKSREARQPNRQSRPSASSLSQNDLVKESDRGFRRGMPLPFVDELIECWVELVELT